MKCLKRKEIRKTEKINHMIAYNLEPYARSPLGRRQLVPVRAKDYVIGA